MRKIIDAFLSGSSRKSVWTQEREEVSSSVNILEQGKWWDCFRAQQVRSAEKHGVASI